MQRELTVIDYMNDRPMKLTEDSHFGFTLTVEHVADNYAKPIADLLSAYGPVSYMPTDKVSVSRLSADSLTNLADNGLNYPRSSHYKSKEKS